MPARPRGGTLPKRVVSLCRIGETAERTIGVAIVRIELEPIGLEKVNRRSVEVVHKSLRGRGSAGFLQEVPAKNSQRLHP